MPNRRTAAAGWTNRVAASGGGLFGRVTAEGASGDRRDVAGSSRVPRPFHRGRADGARTLHTGAPTCMYATSSGRCDRGLRRATSRRRRRRSVDPTGGAVGRGRRRRRRGAATCQGCRHSATDPARHGASGRQGRVTGTSVEAHAAVARCRFVMERDGAGHRPRPAYVGPPPGRGMVGHPPEPARSTQRPRLRPGPGTTLRRVEERPPAEERPRPGPVRDAQRREPPAHPQRGTPPGARHRAAPPRGHRMPTGRRAFDSRARSRSSMAAIRRPGAAPATPFSARGRSASGRKGSSSVGSR